MTFNYWPLLFNFLPFAFVGLVIAVLPPLLGKWVRSNLPVPDIEKISSMPGVQFENTLRQIFEREGWHVDLTKVTGDYGADLILRKDGKKVVVQAKRWKKPVGIRGVQEVVGARDTYNADEAWLVCCSSFTNSAVAQAGASKVRLKDRAWLQSKLKTISQKAA